MIHRVAFIPFALLPQAAFAHEAGAWSSEIEVLLPLLLAATLYCIGVGRIWRIAGSRRGIGGARPLVFGAALALVATLLLSPLDALAEQALSAHMIQHFGLMLVAAPLLVLGRPGLALLWALPAARRPTIARLGSSRTWRAATHPLGAGLLYLVTLWAWHAPPLHQAALAREWIHVAQHASFLGAAIVFWTSALAPLRLERRAGAFLAIFATAVHSCALATLITTANTVWYPDYGPSPLGLSPLADQQFGGLIMWAPCCALLIGAALGTLASVLRGRRGAGGTGGTVRAALAVLAALAGCEPDPADVRAQALISRYGCVACHAVPGIPGPQGATGPPLGAMGEQAYVAGVAPNTRETLAAFIMNPQAIDPRSAMPDLGVTREGAAAIARYLYDVGGGP